MRKTEVNRLEEKTVSQHHADSRMEQRTRVVGARRPLDAMSEAYRVRGSRRRIRPSWVVLAISSPDVV